MMLFQLVAIKHVSLGQISIQEHFWGDPGKPK